MKRLIITFFIMAVTANAGFGQNKSSKGEQGVSSAGLIGGLAIDSRSLMAGIDYRYNILPKLRLAPSFLYVSKFDNLNSLYFNADAHYLVRLTRTATIYPLAGIGVHNRRLKLPAVTTKSSPLEKSFAGTYADGEAGEDDDSKDDDSKEKDGDTTDSHTRLGVNIGFGFENRITQDIILGVEFRHQFTTERIYDQAIFSARLAYYF
ncbi:MAG: porin family protein [Tannerella sp.]|jgi:opacity protein-like surface antigen|nr:porin family protein [Tannerella sp.]